jgi:hypothetical protein
MAQRLRCARRRASSCGASRARSGRAGRRSDPSCPCRRASAPAGARHRCRSGLGEEYSELRRRRLTLCELARGLMPNCSVRHRIKRADRLLGNRALQRERLSLYQMLSMLLVGHCPEPIILVDWSDVKADRSFVLLRATVWTHRFALPIYEEVHPIKRQASPRVERDFLRTLKLLLGDEVRPIVVTDAGFRGPWFKQVERLGWHCVRRMNPTRGVRVRRSPSSPWDGLHSPSRPST